MAYLLIALMIAAAIVGGCWLYYNSPRQRAIRDRRRERARRTGPSGR